MAALAADRPILGSFFKATCKVFSTTSVQTGVLAFAVKFSAYRDFQSRSAFCRTLARRVRSIQSGRSEQRPWIDHPRIADSNEAWPIATSEKSSCHYQPRECFNVGLNTEVSGKDPDWG
jgi:hypothetical protein